MSTEEHEPRHRLIAAPLIAFGEVMLRLASGRGQRLEAATRVDVFAGGSEANVAANVARWGWPSRLVSVLPCGALGDRAAAELASAGIDLRDVEREAGRMGLYWSEAGTGPRPPRILYDRADSAFATFDPAGFDWPCILSGAGCLHLSGITPALGDGPRRATRDAMAEAARQGIPVSFDLNHRAALWSAAEAGAAIRPLLPTLDLLIAAADTLGPVLGIADPGGRSDEALRAMTTAVRRELGPRRIALTLRDGTDADRGGFRGVLDDGAGPLRIGRRLEVPLGGRIGAGDAFAAGLLFADARGLDGGSALDFATAAGALAHTVAADAGPIRVAEIESLAAGQDARIQR